MRDFEGKALLLVVLVLVCGSACSGGGGGGPGGVAQVILGSGVVVEEDRTVSGFERVVHATEGALRISQGAGESLRVRADDNLLPFLLSSVSSGTLQLRTASNVDLRPTQTIEFLLGATSMEGVDLRGIGSVQATDLTTNRLVLNGSGLGQILVSNLTATELDVDLGGFVSATGSGNVDLLAVTLAGFGKVDAPDIQCREAHLRLDGEGDATVRVSDVLVVTITSSGSVYYIGSPTVDATITGTGQVVQIGTDVGSWPPWLVTVRGLLPVPVPSASGADR